MYIYIYVHIYIYIYVYVYIYICICILWIGNRGSLIPSTNQLHLQSCGRAAVFTKSHCLCDVSPTTACSHKTKNPMASKVSIPPSATPLKAPWAKYLWEDLHCSLVDEMGSCIPWLKLHEERFPVKHGYDWSNVDISHSQNFKSFLTLLTFDQYWIGATSSDFVRMHGLSKLHRNRGDSIAPFVGFPWETWLPLLLLMSLPTVPLNVPSVILYLRLICPLWIWQGVVCGIPGNWGWLFG